MPQKPPYLRHPKHGSLFTVILISFLVSSVLAFIVASIVLYFKLNSNFVIPSLILMWLGVAVLSYIAQTKK